MGRFSRSVQICFAHTVNARLTKGPGLQQGASVSTKTAQSVPSASLRFQKPESTREGLCSHRAKNKFLKSLAGATIQSQKAAENVATAMIEKKKKKGQSVLTTATPQAWKANTILRQQRRKLQFRQACDF